VPAPRRLRRALEDYLDLAANSAEKHEFLDGEIFAMGGARTDLSDPIESTLE
jgi:hypothetical protein